MIFLGTGELAGFCLDQLLLHPNIAVKGVITQTPLSPYLTQSRQKKSPPSPVAHKAKKQDLPLWNPKNLNASTFLSQIAELKAQWAIVLAYGKILPKSFLSLFPRQALNFHASLLPRWRGAAPIQRAIMAGDKQLGMTLQVIAPQLDTGDIVSSQSFDLTEDMDSAFVFKKMETLVQKLFTPMIKYMEGQCTAQPQDLSLNIYAHKIQKKESWINWSDPEYKIFNQIRALAMGPHAYTTYNKKRLKILQAQRIKTNMDTRHVPATFNDQQTPHVSSSHQRGASCVFCPGEVIDIGSRYFTVACGDGTAIQVTKVHPESRKKMWVSEYLKGALLKKGDKLGE